MSKEKLLDAFLENPTSYKIKVSDASMLPEKLKNKKEIGFTIKPPVLSVLAKCAKVLQNIPPEITDPEKNVQLAEAINYIDEMAECFAILAHGKTTEFPEWYKPFLINNVTPKEMFYLFSEASLKTQSSFFLNSLQVANVSNPMMMNNPMTKK